MFGIGTGELFLIIIVAIMVLGPEKLPGAMRTFGKFMANVKNATNEIKTEINNTAEVKDLTQSVKKISDKFTGEVDAIKDSVGVPKIDLQNDILQETNKHKHTESIKQDIESLTGPIKRQM